MSETPETTPGIQEPGEYTETVVEYVDNRRQRRVLAVILGVLVLLLVVVAYGVLRLTRPSTAPTTAELPSGVTWVRSLYGWGTQADQQLEAPTDVAIGPDSTIWAISGHSHIVGFNPNGTVKRVIEPKGIVSLEGISVDEDGNLWTADFGGQVLEFRPDGTFVTKWQVELPNVVDVRDGKIAVGSTKGIAVFTPDDQVLMQLGGTRGTDKEQFDVVHGILLGPDGSVYVSDTQNRRVKAYSKDGRLLWISGTAPNREDSSTVDIRRASDPKNPFEMPAGMTMDAKGRIVLVDAFKFKIIVLDAETGKVAKEHDKTSAMYGDYGATDGLFNNPTGIAYDKNRDWFAVADTSNNRIQILRIPESK